MNGRMDMYREDTSLKSLVRTVIIILMVAHTAFSEQVRRALTIDMIKDRTKGRLAIIIVIGMTKKQSISLDIYDTFLYSCGG